MAKVKQPLLSLDASRKLGDEIVYGHRQKASIVETRPIPIDARSVGQLSWRHMFQKVVALWHALSAAEKEAWESLARRRHMTGYAWFISQALRPNPGIYLPLQGGTMQGIIDMGGYAIQNLLDPVNPQDADTEAARDAAIVLHAAIAAAHHARYTNAEADARIALHAAIAAAHHARYTDGEVDAILAVHAALTTGVHGAGDSILATTANIVTHAAIAAAHHARYTNAEADARIAIHAAIAAAHHARYTDAEAVTAAKTVKLDDFATPDDNTDLNASTTRHGLLKKLPNNAAQFLNGVGNWIAVATDAGEGHLVILPATYSSIGQGTWVWAVSGNSMFGGVWVNATNADLDNITYKVFLAVGTYTLGLVYSKGTDSGILDIDIGGAEVASFDLYAGAPSNNNFSTQANIPIAAAGIKDLRLRLHGKNGLSSNFYANLVVVVLWRTA